MRRSFLNPVSILVKAETDNTRKPLKTPRQRFRTKPRQRPPVPMPEANQAKLDSALASLDELTKQELKTVIAMTKELAKSKFGMYTPGYDHQQWRKQGDHSTMLLPGAQG